MSLDRSFPPLLLCALLLTLWGPLACSEDPAEDPPAAEPCSGACPPERCVLDMCQIDMPDAGDDDVDEMDVAQPDPMPDAQPDPEPVDAPEEVSDIEDDIAPDVEDDVAPDVEEDVPDPGCASDDACEPGQICNDRASPPTCREGCRDDDACLGGEICNTLLNICAPGCAGDEDCPPFERCDEGLEACLGSDCSRDTECDDAQFCNPDIGLCTVGCREGGCGLGEFCDTNLRACFSGCRIDDSCEIGEYCDVPSETCTPGCRDDGDCEDDGVCEVVSIGDEPPSQQCVPPECDRDRDCGRDEFCAENVELGRFECAPGCRSDPDNCLSGTVCDVETRRCIAESCQSDDDCPGALVCAPGEGDTAVCQTGCRDDSSCGDGEFCLLDLLRCTCATSDDCVGGAVCDIDICVNPCTGDNDCPEGLSCDIELQLCLDGCRDDFFEPNDGIGEETTAEPGSFPNLRMCYEEAPPLPDCFRLELAEFGVLSLTVTFAHDSGDLNLFVIDPDFVEIGRGDSTTDNETIEAPIEIVGPHILCVEAAGEPFGGTSYNLDIAFTPDE